MIQGIPIRVNSGDYLKTI